MSVHHKVLTSFVFKSVADKEWFLDLLRGDNGLVITRTAKGYVDLELCVSNLNDRQVIAWSTWESQADHEAYMQHRKDSGLFDEVVGRLEGELEVNRLTHLL